MSEELRNFICDRCKKEAHYFGSGYFMEKKILVCGECSNAWSDMWAQAREDSFKKFISNSISESAQD